MKFLKKEIPTKKREEYEFLFSIIALGLAVILFLCLKENLYIPFWILIVPFGFFLYLIVVNNRIGRKQLKKEKPRPR